MKLGTNIFSAGPSTSIAASAKNKSQCCERRYRVTNRSVSVSTPKTSERLMMVEIMIRDEVLNQTVLVQGLPVIIELIAGTVNKIETGLVDIVETSGAVDGVLYSGAAGGANLRALMELNENAEFDADTTMTLKSYLEDCFMFESARPGNSIDWNGMRTGSAPIMTELAKGSSPAIYTTTWLTAGAPGSTTTCDAAWTSINTAASNATFQTEALRKTCSAALYTTKTPGSYGATSTGATELATCSAAIENVVIGLLGLPPTSVNDATSQIAAAKIMFTVMNKGDTYTKVATQGNQQVTSSGFGIGVTANEWIPIIRNVLVAIIICITPLLLLFTPTPLFGQIFGLIFGFFLWIMLWGVIDAMIHGMYIEYAIGYFSALPRGGMGFEFHMQFPEQAEKVLSMLGMMRSTGVMLATIVAGSISKFAGSQAAAQLSGSFMGSIQGSGASAGSNAIETEKAARQKSTFESAGASHAHYSSAQYDYDRSITGASRSQLSQKSAAYSQFTSDADAFSQGAAGGALSGAQNRGKADYIGANGTDAQRLVTSQGMEKQGAEALALKKTVPGGDTNTFQGTAADIAAAEKVAAVGQQVIDGGPQQAGLNAAFVQENKDYAAIGGQKAYKAAGVKPQLVEQMKADQNLHKMLGEGKGAQEIADYMNKQYPGAQLTANDAYSLAAEAQRLGTAGGVGQIVGGAGGSTEMMNQSVTSTQNQIGTAQADRGMAAALGMSQQNFAKAKTAGQGVKMALSGQQAANLNKWGEKDPNWQQVKAGDVASLSFQGDATRISTAGIDVNGSHRTNDYSVNSTEKRDTTNLTDNYSGPGEERKTYTPAGTASTQHDAGGNLISGNVNGLLTKSTIQNVAIGDGGGKPTVVKETYNPQSPGENSVLRLTESGELDRRNEHAVRIEAGFMGNGLLSGVAYEVGGERARNVVGGVQSLTKEIEPLVKSSRMFKAPAARGGGGGGGAASASGAAPAGMGGTGYSIPPSATTTGSPYIYR